MLLATALLCANLLFTLHSYDLAAHPCGDPCELCLGAPGFGLGLIATAITVSAGDHAAPLASLRRDDLGTAPTADYAARAPPDRHTA
jgi:hypothetical protein